MSKHISNDYVKLVKLNMQRLKKEKNWTITKMALLIDISDSYLAHLLSLKSNKVPSIQLLGLIADKAKVPITYFFKNID